MALNGNQEQHDGGNSQKNSHDRDLPLSNSPAYRNLPPQQDNLSPFSCPSPAAVCPIHHGSIVMSGV
jgi:hypothetical protein